MMVTLSLYKLWAEAGRDSWLQGQGTACMVKAAEAPSQKGNAKVCCYPFQQLV